jgi:hypothetical protein
LIKNIEEKNQSNNTPFIYEKNVLEIFLNVFVTQRLDGWMDLAKTDSAAPEVRGETLKSKFLRGVREPSKKDEIQLQEIFLEKAADLFMKLSKYKDSPKILELANTLMKVKINLDYESLLEAVSQEGIEPSKYNNIAKALSQEGIDTSQYNAIAQALSQEGIADYKYNEIAKDLSQALSQEDVDTSKYNAIARALLQKSIENKIYNKLAIALSQKGIEDRWCSQIAKNISGMNLRTDLGQNLYSSVVNAQAALLNVIEINNSYGA